MDLHVQVAHVKVSALEWLCEDIRGKIGEKVVAIMLEAEVGSGFDNFDVVVFHEIHCVSNPGLRRRIAHRSCLSGENGSAKSLLYICRLNGCVDPLGCKFWSDLLR